MLLRLWVYILYSVYKHKLKIIITLTQNYKNTYILLYKTAPNNDYYLGFFFF